MIFILQQVLQSRFMTYMQEIKFIYNKVMLTGAHGVIVNKLYVCALFLVNGSTV